MHGSAGLLPGLLPGLLLNALPSLPMTALTCQLTLVTELEVQPSRRVVTPMLSAAWVSVRRARGPRRWSWRSCSWPSFRRVALGNRKASAHR